MEIKTLPVEACELKFNDDEWRVEGYASAFNSVDSYGDTIEPGAFVESLKSGREIRMHFEHMRWTHPGRWTELSEDEYGLRAIGYLTREHSLAKDLRASMRHGTVRGLSIGFIPLESEEKDDGGRVLKRVDLFEVSFTGTPAEPKAVIESWKSELLMVHNLADFERFLRDSGSDISKSQATALTSRLKAILLGDPDEKPEEIERNKEREYEELKALTNRYQLKILNLTRR